MGEYMGNPKMVTFSLRLGLLAFCLLLGPASCAQRPTPAPTKKPTIKSSEADRLLRNMSTHRPSSSKPKKRNMSMQQTQEKTNQLLEKLLTINLSATRKLGRLAKSNAAIKAALDKLTPCIGMPDTFSKKKPALRTMNYDDDECMVYLPGRGSPPARVSSDSSGPGHQWS